MKYKSKNNLLNELNSLGYFTKERIAQLGGDEKKYNLTETTIDTYISRFLKHKEIIPLKRGLYVSQFFYNNKKNHISYTYFLANILRQPSYISSWTALQYYNLTTEIIHTITSVSLKATRNYRTKVGTFAYQTIKNDLFFDYSLINKEFDFFMASPSKALFDLLYFRTKQFRGIKFEDINILIDDLRIDISEMENKEKKKFYSLIKSQLNG